MSSQKQNLIGVYAPSNTPIPGADLDRPVYKHFKSKVYIFYFEATASWQVAEMKDLGRPRAVLYSQGYFIISIFFLTLYLLSYIVFPYILVLDFEFFLYGNFKNFPWSADFN